MTLAAAGTILPAGCSSTIYEKEVRQNTNVILISADDLGYGDLGCYGSRDIKSPNIDKLAANGVRFTNFYSSSCVCTPARGCMLTGLFPQELGLGGPLMGEGGMAHEFETLADVLSKADYTTGMVGKWHLGYSGDELPNEQGFDYFFGFRGGKIDFYAHTDTAQKADDGNPMGKHDLYENENEVFLQGDYSTELFTDKALDFIRANKNKHFFLNLAYNAPHYSKPGLLQAPSEYIKRFSNSDNPTRREIYAAMVACMDDGIGQIMQTLDELNIADNTVVIFVSDNGADENHGGDNGQLRGGKWTLWEGGLKVPLIMKFPDMCGKGTFNQRVHMIDIFPTVLSSCGIETAPEYGGFDIGKYISDKSEMPERKLYFSHNHPKYGNQIALYEGKWKYVVIENQQYLFDIFSDPYESENLIESQADVALSMSKAYDDWIKSL